MQEVKYEELEGLQQSLLSEAARVMNTAYNPYSNFYVGAALLSQDRRIIAGSNVENAAYGSTICAERAAILRANAISERNIEVIMSTTKKDKIIVATIEELLPLGFGPKDLGINIKKYQ